MIFKPELVKKILSGDKTQTRRPVKIGTHGEIPCPHEVGDILEVKAGRFDPPACSIRITRTGREKWNAITTEDARASGFGSRRYPSDGFEITPIGNYMDYVQSKLYPMLDWKSDCWVFEFERVSG